MNEWCKKLLNAKVAENPPIRGVMETSLFHTMWVQLHDPPTLEKVCRFLQPFFRRMRELEQRDREHGSNFLLLRHTARNVLWTLVYDIVSNEWDNVPHEVKDGTNTDGVGSMLLSELRQEFRLELPD